MFVVGVKFIPGYKESRVFFFMKNREKHRIFIFGVKNLAVGNRAKFQANQGKFDRVDC